MNTAMVSFDTIVRQLTKTFQWPRGASMVSVWLSRQAPLYHRYSLTPIKYQMLIPVFPIRCTNTQYHQTICTVKSHSRALATFFSKFNIVYISYCPLQRLNIWLVVHLQWLHNCMLKKNICLV